MLGAEGTWHISDRIRTVLFSDKDYCTTIVQNLRCLISGLGLAYGF